MEDMTMVTQENGNGKKSPKFKYFIASIIVATVIVMASVGYVVFVKDDGEGDYIRPPSVLMHGEKEGEHYNITIVHIYPETNNSKWLSLEQNLSFSIIREYTPEEIDEGADLNEGKIFGFIIDILDNYSSPVTYIDADANYMFSVNDYFLVDVEIIKYEYMSFILHYRGDKSESLPKEYSTNLGYIHFGEIEDDHSFSLFSSSVSGNFQDGTRSSFVDSNLLGVFKW